MYVYIDKTGYELGFLRIRTESIAVIIMCVFASAAVLLCMYVFIDMQLLVCRLFADLQRQIDGQTSL